MAWRIYKDISEPEDSKEKSLRWCVIHTKDSDKILKPLIVIGINPSGKSLKDDNGNDVFSRTAIRLHAIADESGKGFDSIFLFNVTPAVDVSASDLATRADLAEHNDKNIEVIKSVLDEYQLDGTPVLLCFGNTIRKIGRNPEMKDVLYNILHNILHIDSLDGRCCYSLGPLTGKGCPRHPLFNKHTDLREIKVTWDESGLPEFENLQK